MLVLGGGSVLIAAINHVADGETSSTLTSFDLPESPWMHAVFLSGPVDRRAFRYLRPPTDPPGPASIVEACFGRCQARLHAGQPGWAA